MSVLFRGALVAAALAIAGITPATAQKLKDGTAITITPSGEMKMMKHKHGTTVPAGYIEVVGHTDTTHTTMIMVGGKMYMRTTKVDPEATELFK
jgi:hypothetical protein